MKKKPVTLHMFFFPLWFLVLFAPGVWPLSVPVSLAISLLTLWIALKLQKASAPKKTLFFALIKTWVIGILSYLLLALSFLPVGYLALCSSWWAKEVALPAASEPFSTIEAFLWLTLWFSLSLVLSYWLNKKWTLRKFDLADRQKKRAALILMLGTAPYIFYLPNHILYAGLL